MQQVLISSIGALVEKKRNQRISHYVLNLLILLRIAIFAATISRCTEASIASLGFTEI